MNLISNVSLCCVHVWAHYEYYVSGELSSKMNQIELESGFRIEIKLEIPTFEEAGEMRQYFVTLTGFSSPSFPALQLNFPIDNNKHITIKSYAYYN